MTIKDTINLHYTKPHEKDREIGRYFASEIWGIYKGYVTTGNFLTGRPMDKTGQAMVFRGEAMETRLAQILIEEETDFHTQERGEIEVGKGIFISGKTDFSLPDKIVETKCPDKPTYGIPEKWKFQLELYYRMFGKPVWLGIFAKDGDEIIRFYPYTPSKETYELIIETVLAFHNRLIKKYAKTKGRSKIKV